MLRTVIYVFYEYINIIFIGIKDNRNMMNEEGYVCFGDGRGMILERAKFRGDCVF